MTEGKITKYATALGYSAPEYAVTLHGLGNLSTFAASYYHRVSPDVEAGAKAVYDTRAAPKGNVALEVGAKMYLDNAAFVKAKINNTGILALGAFCLLSFIREMFVVLMYPGVVQATRSRSALVSVPRSVSPLTPSV